MLYQKTFVGENALAFFRARRGRRKYVLEHRRSSVLGNGEQVADFMHVWLH